MTMICIIAAGACQAITIGFADSYYKAAPGQTVQLVTQLSEPVPNGLEGYAIKLTFPSQAATLVTTDIWVPAELDFDFLDPGAAREVGPGYASVAGYTELGQPAYTGTQFAVFTLTIPSNAPLGVYSVELGKLLQAGINFVDSNGQSVDASIQYGSATLEIVPPRPAESINDLTVEWVDGHARLTFSCIPGWNYAILRSSDLIQFTEIEIIRGPANGIIQFLDPVAAGASPVFYTIAEAD